MKDPLPDFRTARGLGLALTPVARPLKSDWYRAVQTHFLTGTPQAPPTPLSTGHTATIPGRFNPGTPTNPSFPVLYLGEDHMVALFEVQALLGSLTLPGGPVPHPRTSWAILTLTVRLNTVADLTDVPQQAIFGTNAQELTGDWRGYGSRTAYSSVASPRGVPAPTQKLGHALYGYPLVEGFVTPSARLPEKMNLVVFPDKLLPGSRIEFVNPEDKVKYVIEGPNRAGEDSEPTFKASEAADPW